MHSSFNWKQFKALVVSENSINKLSKIISLNAGRKVGCILLCDFENKHIIS